MLRPIPFKQLIVAGLLAASVLLATPLWAQSQLRRLPSDLSGSGRVALDATAQPIAQAQLEVGRMASNYALNGLSLVFKRSAAQEADLQALLKAQQDPESPLYHQWLTPEEFGARFGMSDADLATAQQWLEQQGFAVLSVDTGRNAIRFSGTAGQVEQAFATEMHYYQVGAERYFAPSTALSLPAAMAPAVIGIRNLNNIRPMPHKKRDLARPGYTLNNNGSQYVFFAPGDIKVAYGLNSVANAGYTGTGQTIAIAGQSAISTTDITNFQNASGLTQKLPTLTLVPNTGTSTACSGDQGESDLDLEWASAIAPGATINFVYTGVDSGQTCDTTSAGVYDAVVHAINNHIGNIISLSYGTCETFLSDSDYTWWESYGSQAAAQGQTIVVSSGDDGSTACYAWFTSTKLTMTQKQALSASFPATSAFVTAVGGTEITDANNQVGTYWDTATTNSVKLTTAKSYIPEVAWNDDSASIATQYGPKYARSAGGGGVSAGVARPSWQTGVPGIPSTSTYTKRMIPDVSLYASPGNPGFLFCSSDTSDWSTNQKGSCGNSQFYDSVSGYFTSAGGTSFSAPIFAGMVAILNQAKGYTSGSGLINSTLYKTASSSTAYASSFHDITAGGPAGTSGWGNECEAGTYCSTEGASAYHTTTGYDMATGLGSPILSNLISAWGTVISSSMTVTPSSASVNTGTIMTFTMTVNATTTPTGTVNLTLDGSSVGICTLTNGSCTYQMSFATAGTHTMAAAYNGDATHSDASASGSVTVTSATASATTTTITPWTSKPLTGETAFFDIAVAGGTTTPSGSVLVQVDGATAGTYALSGGAYTFSTTFASSGSHTVAATYLGDTTHAMSTGASTVSVVATTTTAVTPSTSTPTVNVNTNFVIQVTGGSTTPTGSVQVVVDGTTKGTYTLSSGSYTYTTSFATAASHTVAANYLGDTTHGVSNGSSTVVATTTPTACSGSNCFTLAVSPGTSGSPLTVSQGSTGTSTVTITSLNNYAGTVAFSMTTSSTSFISYGCYVIANKAVTANATATQTLSIYTSTTACDAAGAVQGGPPVQMLRQTGAQNFGSAASTALARKWLPLGGVAMAGLLLLGLRRRRAWWMSTVGSLLLLGALSVAIGCGGGSSSGSGTTNYNVPKGTYTLTLIGADSVTASITNTTSVTVTVN